jgi:aspartokinase
MKNIKIMKFGGSSLGNGGRILHVANIVKSMSRNRRIVVIVSAMSKITDSLISIFNKYKSGDILESLGEVRNIYDIHKKALLDLNLDEKNSKEAEDCLKNLFGNFFWRTL